MKAQKLALFGSFALSRVFFCPQADISGEKAQSQELYGILLIGIHAAMVIAIIVQAYFAVQVRAPRKNRRRKFPEEISVLSTMTPFVVAAVIKLSLIHI